MSSAYCGATTTTEGPSLKSVDFVEETLESKIEHSTPTPIRCS